MLRVALPLLLVLASACATSRGGRAAIDEIDDLIARQRFHEAVLAADALRQERPGDEAAEQVHRRATVAFLLEQARRATFAGELDRALEHVQHAGRLWPESETVRQWRQKTEGALARRWLERAMDLYARGNLEAAALAYQQVLVHDPASQSAAAGLAEVNVQVEYRAGLGQQYYDEAVRALTVLWLEQARSRFSYAGKYLGDDRSRRRERQVEGQLAEQRLAMAEKLEEAGLFAAAATEYRLALHLDPELGGAREGQERAQRESVARQRLRDADMDVVRRDFDRALRMLDEGEELSELQAERFAEARERVHGARLESLYRAAIDRERDFRYEEAIEAYEHLLSQVDFFKDARTRRDTLRDYVLNAERLWREALATQDDTVRLALLRQISVFWPEYRDLPDRIASLEARLQE